MQLELQELESEMWRTQGQMPADLPPPSNQGFHESVGVAIPALQECSTRLVAAQHKTMKALGYLMQCIDEHEAVTAEVTSLLMLMLWCVVR